MFVTVQDLVEYADELKRKLGASARIVYNVVDVEDIQSVIDENNMDAVIDDELVTEIFTKIADGMMYDKDIIYDVLGEYFFEGKSYPDDCNCDEIE